MAALSITSATSIFFITIPGVFPTPQQLQQFAADDVFSTDALESAEVQMGVDGFLSAGFVFVPVKQQINLQANSISGDIFDQWYASQQLIKDIYPANGVVVLPSQGKKWTMTNGVMSSYMPIPDSKKVLQPRRFAITWESVTKAPV